MAELAVRLDDATRRTKTLREREKNKTCIHICVYIYIYTCKHIYTYMFVFICIYKYTPMGEGQDWKNKRSERWRKNRGDAAPRELV